ncbi:MAG: bifunctional proline dehydrogenase/L-glutamate gamma-semialdehyde dehydrogenase PutA [Boseongicola sp. SB0662_bin_57]|nr:bifunctional proline dehydrogenase/L-glutamate gamma-semialdehyde dehydrogenase PutA [Boseongicola sp. SB0662_bin_57]
MSRDKIRASSLTEESALVRSLVEATALDATDRTAIGGHAARLVNEVRAGGQAGRMEAFLAEYGLSTKEGVALMCLAEAMLRVPDARTVDELIRDKITPHDWAAHVGDSGSILVNASTWALMLTGRILDDDGEGVAGTLHAIVRRLGEPVVRTAVGHAMAEMGAQFVLGETIESAIERGAMVSDQGCTYSFDMLGEAARTEHDAERYRAAYQAAISAIAHEARDGEVRNNPGMSVKLSALHPRYERSQAKTMLPEMAERLLPLALAAAEAGIGLNIDAEEADRLDLSLDVTEHVLANPALADWDGFGVVVQAYGRRAMPTIDWLYDLSARLNRRIMVRLVKGAYWDTEIKRAQVLGLKDYPVFTRKAHTDISFLAGARRLLAMRDRVYPQFATHNAHSVAAILHMASGDRSSFEFQRLHGMGDALHDLIRQSEGTRCRIYAPVGTHKDLLAYLVRRLLENGANSSFVHQIVDSSVSAEEIARDPLAAAEAADFAPNPAMPKPSDVFAPRPNSRGWDITDPVDLAMIDAGREPFQAPFQWSAAPLSPCTHDGKARNVVNPADPNDIVGKVVETHPDRAAEAVTVAIKAQPAWESLGARKRAEVLRQISGLFEANAAEIFALLAREAGKTLIDAVAEIREAVDFLRYYADEAERAGDNCVARGVIVCISPWNFPLAIFTGQIAAALAAGNAAIAKPAEQTPLIASRATAWMREAGVPDGVIQFLPGEGSGIGAKLTADSRIGGVCFTGSTDTAHVINRQLAETAPDALLIAETGGMNAMIVDSTALLEQATRDIVRSAFQSSGQRCSSLRALYVQADIEAELVQMIEGAIDTLVIGDPRWIETDIGPVIDAEAHEGITAYIDAQAAAGRVIKRMPIPASGFFVPPTLIRVDGIEDVEREVFGPVLHLASFDGDQIDQVIDKINAKGFGLTFGLHSRIDRRVQRILDRIDVGNVYVNRDQVGAVVGSQPFGGHGLSGTGPKAGGPNFLSRLFIGSRHPGKVRLPGKPVGLAEIEEAIEQLSSAPVTEPAERMALLRAQLREGSTANMSGTAAVAAGPLDLPGPTGESNQLELRPKGTILCLGPGTGAILAQAVQALAAGNRVVAVSAAGLQALKRLSGSGLPVRVLQGSVESPASLGSLQIDAVAAALMPDDARFELRKALAARDGPIVPLITELNDPMAFCNERSICIDTTASGGNAALLAESDP